MAKRTSTAAPSIASTIDETLLSVVEEAARTIKLKLSLAGKGPKSESHDINNYATALKVVTDVAQTLQGKAPGQPASRQDENEAMRTIGMRPVIQTPGMARNTKEWAESLAKHMRDSSGDTA